MLQVRQFFLSTTVLGHDWKCFNNLWYITYPETELHCRPHFLKVRFKKHTVHLWILFSRDHRLSRSLVKVSHEVMNPNRTAPPWSSLLPAVLAQDPDPALRSGSLVHSDWSPFLGKTGSNSSVLGKETIGILLHFLIWPLGEVYRSQELKNSIAQDRSFYLREKCGENTLLLILPMLQGSVHKPERVGGLGSPQTSTWGHFSLQLLPGSL